jgi:hypothetical protein
MMAVSCVALAEMMIKARNLRAPSSYSEVIDIVGEHQTIPAEFAYDFARIAGFRNFLAHDLKEPTRRYLPIAPAVSRSSTNTSAGMPRIVELKKIS